MKLYVSVPEGVEGYFRSLYPDEDIILGHDPEGKRVGSGGAVKYLLRDREPGEKSIVINAGGEARRLPAYNGYGKVLMPMPVAKWSRGQQISQRLFDLQRDYLERLAEKSPGEIAAVVASGDVLITLPQVLPPLPEADIILVGLWSDARTMGKHGVFLCDPDDPRYYEGMVQKPTSAELDKLGKNYLTLLDSGTWLLSRKALEYLETFADPVDLYTDLIPFPDDLKVSVYPIEEGDFFHFGSTQDLIESTVRYQNRYRNQRRLLSKRWKLHSKMFVQNALLGEKLSDEAHSDIWIENSHIPRSWTLSRRHVLTGIPKNDLTLTLPEGVCLDAVPLKDGRGWALKIYRYEDTFKDGMFFGRKIDGDLYDAPLFPLMTSVDELPALIESTINGIARGQFTLRELPRLTDWDAVERQRKAFYKESLSLMQTNWDRSVFYHSDLLAIGKDFDGTPLPLPEEAPLLIKMQDAAFRAELGLEDPDKSSEVLSVFLKEGQRTKGGEPYRNIFSDQLIWSRSPVRIDLAGGWTDTPPYCVYEGGTVVNLAVTLNGQEPIQVYVRPCDDETITISSIDLASSITISDIASLLDYKEVGSAFSIPKAALVLCGVGRGRLYEEPDEDDPFHTDQKDRETQTGLLSGYGSKSFSWSDLIDSIGGGLRITLFSAVPAGSGLGTSSILGATVLSALSEYFGLGWDKTDICHKTLILEQMLTTGGGWQDQFGGIFGGAKVLTTESGSGQTPSVRFLPAQVFSGNGSQVLYYTGLTRRAKDILSHIKDRMMLNDHRTLSLLRHIKALGLEMSEAISKADYTRVGCLLRESWEANKALDPGTSTPEIESIARDIDDLALGYKLPGAGGGGFMYILAKDPAAAGIIRERLSAKSRGTARLVEIELSAAGNRTTRS